YFVKDEFPEADIDRVIRMCMFHDMGEAFTGDIPAFEKTEQHEVEETRRVEQWLASLPEPYRIELVRLFTEMEAQETLEAKIYKALDKMEALISHNEADIATWLPLEYDLNLVYGTEQVKFSEYMQRLKAEINQDTRDKIDKTDKTDTAIV
ncbi:MAG: HD domain-containing protein, partial [Lachnospiraceae bacterium]|nr:HD domain-containing protein [Lachnospiraceae bacterium]